MLRSDLHGLMQKHLAADESRVLELRFGLADGASRTIRQARGECVCLLDELSKRHS